MEKKSININKKEEYGTHLDLPILCTSRKQRPVWAEAHGTDVQVAFAVRVVGKFATKHRVSKTRDPQHAYQTRAPD